MSVCKLKQLSNLLGCSFSFLRYNVCAKYHNAKPFTNYNNATRCYTSSVNKLQDSLTQTIDINAITKGDEILTKKLKVLILEVDVMRQEAMRVPNSLTDEKWSELLDLPSRNQRIKFLNYLWLNEKKKENRKLNKERAQLEREAMPVKDEEEEDEHIKYGFGGSTIFIRIYNNTIDNFYNQRLIRAMMFGQDVVIDCSYDEYMNHIEASLCAKQLKILFADNRLRNDPFNIHFCNVNKKGNVFSKLHKIIPTMYNDEFPINVTDKSYLELFNKEKLVYLTPHCRNDLVEYSQDDIYIVGAMVDKVNVDPLSLGKAKALGLRMAKLPLDRYLDWRVGGKSLTINQMLLILNEMKTSGDWAKALDLHVPKRKLRNKYDENKPLSKRKIKYRSLIY